MIANRCGTEEIKIKGWKMSLLTHLCMGISTGCLIAITFIWLPGIHKALCSIETVLRLEYYRVNK